MIHASGYEYVVFLILFGYGFLSGFLGSVIIIPYQIKQKNYMLKNILNFFSVIVFFALLFLAINFHNFGQFRLYLAISFLLGWLLWKKTLGKPFAKLTSVVYNKLNKTIYQFKQTKIGKILFK